MNSADQVKNWTSASFFIIAGMVAMGIVATDVKKGLFPARVEYVGIYWHFVDMVWLFLFPLFYIASGAS